MPWVLRKKGGEAIAIDREVSIGRDPTCTIRIQAPAVSRIHCRLQPANDHVILLDEGRNGTLVNGIRVGKVAHVRVGDVIEVDTEHFQIQRVVPIAQQQETQDLAFVREDAPTLKKKSSKPVPAISDQTKRSQSESDRHIAAPPLPPPAKSPPRTDHAVAVAQAPVQPPRMAQPPTIEQPMRMPMPTPQNEMGWPLPNQVAPLHQQSQPPPQPRASNLPPTMYPPPPPPAGGDRPPADLSAPTTEVSAARVRPDQQQIPFEVEVVEDPAVSAIRYRDAVRLVDEQALLIMTDFGATHSSNPNLPPELVAQWKGAVRKAGSKGKGPDEVLRILNKELMDANLQATATCVRLVVRERLIAVACAGTAAPFVLRSGNRMAARTQTNATVALGRVRAAQFQERTLHFDRGDTLLLPSAAFYTQLDQLLSQPFQLDPNMRIAEWIRHHRIHPPGGSLLCLTLR